MIQRQAIQRGDCVIGHDAETPGQFLRPARRRRLKNVKNSIGNKGQPKRRNADWQSDHTDRECQVFVRDDAPVIFSFKMLFSDIAQWERGGGKDGTTTYLPHYCPGPDR